VPKLAGLARPGSGATAAGGRLSEL
jgi:hypothetical protein